MTTAVSLKEFRAKTDEILDSVIEGEETVIVTLADGRKFALVPGAEWQRMDETSYLTSSSGKRPIRLLLHASVRFSTPSSPDPSPASVSQNR